jgi:nucleotide-binding universal stress UspA family protein
MEFRRVVVGVDFSAASLAAARWVATQLAPQAEIVLVHVLPEPEAPPPVRPYLPPMLEVVAELAPSLYGGLRGVAELIDAGRTRIDMRAGVPADGLAAAAADVGADLVCLGRTHSRRGSARFGATTAQRVLARSPLPLLVVPAATATSSARTGLPARILAAVDAHEARGRHVVHAAWRLALSCEARVDALHVLGPEVRALVRAHRRPGSRPVQPPRALARSRGEPSRRVRDDGDLLRVTREWIGRRLDEVGVPTSRATAHVRVGDPGQEIVGFAHAANVDLITIGRGGDHAVESTATAERAPASRPSAALPLGSTTRLVTWAAPCAVLVVPCAPAPPKGPSGTSLGTTARRGDASRSVASLASDPAAGGLPPAAAHRPPGPGPGRGASAVEDAA